MESGAFSSTKTTGVFDQAFEDMQSPVDHFICRPQAGDCSFCRVTLRIRKGGGRLGSQNVCFHNLVSDLITYSPVEEVRN